ncbi:MAG TPA: urease accessory UreF family protein [Devosiaceae bacterium]|jgi:urease accessory protein|nr:urease accessory UreF family protein [Devosiaceae bacterium]
MTEPAALQKLLTWLSPAFPVGTFAWSSGLETAIAERLVTDSATMRNWLSGSLRHGVLRTDAILLAEAHRRSGTDLEDLAALSLALSPASERLTETLAIAHSFSISAAAWPVPEAPPLPESCPYPIALGALAAAHGIDLEDLLLAFLTAAVHAQVSVAVRLVPLGQTEGLRVVASLEPLVAAAAAAAATSTLEHIGTIAYAADIAQMRHETQETRLFRS